MNTMRFFIYCVLSLCEDKFCMENRFVGEVRKFVINSCLEGFIAFVSEFNKMISSRQRESGKANDMYAEHYLFYL